MSIRERLPALAYDRPVTVWVGFMALLVIGIIAASRIPVQLMPSGIDPKFLFVWVGYPNSAPLETDDRIVGPIEEQLSTVNGLKTVRSSASSGQATFRLMFWGSADMDTAYNAVTDRLERAMPEMPDDVDRYLVFRFSPDDQPVLWVGASLGENVEDPYHLLERVVKPRLERIRGVASVDVYGVPKNIVAIEYERDKLFAHGVDLGGVQRRLATDNFQLGSGRFEEGGRVRNVRSLSNLQVGELEDYPVRDSLTLGDIATIRRGGVRSASIWRVDGEDAAAMAIQKESGANTQDVCDAIVAEFADLELDPRVQGSKFHVFFNQGDLIDESLGVLIETAITGGVFALIILWVFLREWRMTLLIATSIPLSLLLTVAGLYFFGMDLNVLSLMGLMLAVGMVVDNAIVVVETIYRHRAEGESRREAAVMGTAEVNLAILASTATTMVVFLPVMLMSENAQISFFMKVMGTPVVLALAASLLVALVFAPLATRYMGEAEIRPDPRWLVWLQKRYEQVLRFVLTRRADTAMALAAAALLTFGVAVPGVQCSGASESNLNDFEIRVSVPPQSGAQDRDDIMKRFESMIEEHREDWGVRVFSARMDGDGNDGEITVYLESNGPLARDEVMEQARKSLPSDLAGVTSSVGWDDGDGSSSKSIDLSIYGEDMGTLLGLASEVERRIGTVDGVMGTRIEQARDGADEIRVQLRRDALARYGVEAAQIGNTLAFALRPNQLPPLTDQGRELELRSSFTLEDRSDIDTVLDLQVFSPNRGSFVPIRVLADLEFGKGPVSIERTNRRTSVRVQVDLHEDTTPQDVYGRLDSALGDMAFPRGTGWSKGDQYDAQNEDNAALLLAMMLSISFVFLLIGMLFESFLLPVGIISTIPMAMFGSMWGLFLMETSMDMMATIGLVILVGVVVNNGIVLVDSVIQLRSDGLERTEALIQAGGQRLRPILMTALTTICGLLPMAFGSSSFIGIPYAPLGRTVISGLLVGTLLTLVLVPYLYAWLDDLGARLRRWAGYVVGPRAATEEKNV